MFLRMSPQRNKFKPNLHKSRKQFRKEERKNKKMRRFEYYTNRKKPGQYVLAPKKDFLKQEENVKMVFVNKKVENEKMKSVEKKQPKKTEAEANRDKEKRQQLKLQKQMHKQRNKQLQEANLEEDLNIKRLEKQLKLNKRKSKAVPASFARDGLDYLLEVCDPENLKTSALAEQQLVEVNDEFAEDFALMTEEAAAINKGLNAEESEEDEWGEEEESADEDELEEESAEEDELGNEQEEDFEPKPKKRKSESSEDEFGATEQDAASNSSEKDGTWEDIYGRLRAKDGSILTQTDKYLPPAARLSLNPEDKARCQKLEKLKKHLKGLINRLAESNMYNIASQIEELYMHNSRNDMNSTITNLILEALVSHILAPERLLMEHVLLIVILHANIGTEVGAHFLQTVIKQFSELLTNSNDKRLDNLVVILAQLYNFKLFDSKLIYEIINKLLERFGEKEVECILHILRSVGFNLRKDNPLALKALIVNLQKRAAGVSDDLKDNPRVKFMLEILLAIKNNNMSKIPNYDNSYSEHLKKIMKGFIRKGNYVTQLNISLEDLLKADEKGKWWVVGSAWAGKTPDDEYAKNSPNTASFSQKLLQLATKQRMNTDTRKNIFCIIMSAEDYLDAFEKLLRLALKNQQERDIIHVILHCCLQEKTYNPFYATLAQKFCEYDRKFMMTIRCSIWDKLKVLNEHSSSQISHLAKLLTHLFIEKGLPISTLKIVQFSELDKVSLRFIRQILLGILLHEDLEVCKSVFDKVGHSEKLKMFRESLRLFLHHFLLKNLDGHSIAEEKKLLLQQRVKVVEKLLSGKYYKLQLLKLKQIEIKRNAQATERSKFRRRFKHKTQLKLNKRKSKAVPASFARDGLDYLLEVCDPENLKTSALAEQQLAEVNDEFVEDFALMTEEAAAINKGLNAEEAEEDEWGEEEESADEDELVEESADEDELGDEQEEEFEPKPKKRKSESSEDEFGATEQDAASSSSEKDGTWEDIYGRLRAKDGSILTQTDKYLPPAARLSLNPEDKARCQKLEKLKKHLKGLINRLAESNMHNIASQIEELYMNNSRSDTNNTITSASLAHSSSRKIANGTRSITKHDQF